MEWRLLLPVVVCCLPDGQGDDERPPGWLLLLLTHLNSCLKQSENVELCVNLSQMLGIKTILSKQRKFRIDKSFLENEVLYYET